MKKHLFVLLVFVLSSCATATGFKKPGVDFRQYNKIAVIRFDCSMQQSIGQEVADIIGMEYAKKGYHVVERSQLKAIIDEEAIRMYGLTKETQNNLHIAGIKAVVVGSVSRYDCQPRSVPIFYMGVIMGVVPTNNCHASLSCKMLDVNTGDMIWSANGSHSLNAANMTANKVLQDVIELIEREIPEIDAASSTTYAPQTVAKQDTSITPVDKAKMARKWANKSYNSVLAKNWPEVITSSSVAILLDPSLIGPYINRAFAYCETGSPQKALVDCDKALQMQPNNAFAHNNKGYALQLLNQRGVAALEYEISCDLGYAGACKNLQKIGK